MCIQLHPRTELVQKAENDLRNIVWEWAKRHEVTYLESLQCLALVQETFCKYAIRHERHPEDPTKKGDEA
jgi:hypothetical protein